MKLPVVNAVGLVETPPEFRAEPRVLPRRVRIAVGILLAAFLVAVVGTTVVSVGRYCLTSDGGDTRELRKR